jgi:seryl-tRNA synthetase
MGKVIFDEEDLTPEGKRLYKNIDKINEQLNTITVTLPPVELPPIEINPTQADNDHLRLEIARMIKNSELVVRDCNKILAKCKNEKEYLLNDCRIAKTIHENNIIRLTRILDGLPAFDYHIPLDDE